MPFLQPERTMMRGAGHETRTGTEAWCPTTGGGAGRILIVDDELHIRRMLEHYLSRLGHRVHTAGSVPEAVKILAAEQFDLVLTDFQMPGQTGLDLLDEIRSRAPDTRMMLMSAHADIETAVTAIDRGIDQLVVKPFELHDLSAKVTASLHRRRALQTAEQEKVQLEAHLQQREAESNRLILRGALSLAAAVEAKDKYTAGHADRVTAYSLTIASAMPHVDLARFALAGKLHDVGKIGVPDLVLNKPDRLTNEEFERVKQHPEMGERILEPLIDDPLVLGVVRWHHERWDGRGYPDGRAGEEIPLEARVLAVADTLDAMTSRRAYRDGLPWQAAVEEIRRCSGGQFDPGVVAVFERVLERLATQYTEFALAPSPEMH